MTGWGTNTCLSSDIPFTAATERATRSNLSVCIATVGTPYCASIVIACAGGRRARDDDRSTVRRSHGRGVVLEIDARDRLEHRPHTRHVLAEPRLHLLEEDVGVVEAAVDQIDGLALERR